MKKNKSTTIDHDDIVRDLLEKDPDFMQKYLMESINEYQTDKDLRAFLQALKLIASAKPGGISALAQKSGLNRSQLYRMFNSGNPTLKTMQTILDYLNLELSIQPRTRKATNFGS